MRLDKFLKVSRIIKRRAIAKDFCDSDRVWVNDREAKASSKIKPNDIVRVKFGNNLITFKVLELNESTKKNDAKDMYEIIEEKKVEEDK
ncbi:MAG: RNA-binding S4 domain-containing protein [Clostridia bacterium]|nr:RNA-binding S4 domain-containing protein [Clostridia bacterium]